VRVVLQRVSRAEVRIDGRARGAISTGCVLLVGIGASDDEGAMAWMADKIISLRIFPEPPDAGEKRSSFARTLEDVQGGVLVVSQFTLHGDTRKGTRPSFTHAAPPGIAIPLYELFVELLRQRMPGRVETGEFGAMMEVELVNDGPVTLILER
jgi:D-aminoacyl-tRNA deacylase